VTQLWEIRLKYEKEDSLGISVWGTWYVMLEGALRRARVPRNARAVSPTWGALCAEALCAPRVRAPFTVMATCALPPRRVQLVHRRAGRTARSALRLKWIMHRRYCATADFISAIRSYRKRPSLACLASNFPHLRGTIIRAFAYLLCVGYLLPFLLLLTRGAVFRHLQKKKDFVKITILNFFIW